MTNVLPDKVKAEVKDRVPVRRLGEPEDIADLVATWRAPRPAISPGR